MLVRSLTGFDWTPDGSEAFRRAATDTSQATTAAAAAACPGQGRGGGDGSHGATTGAGAVSPLDSGKPSKAPPRGSMFDRFGFPGKVFPDGGGLGGTAGGGGGGSVLQRRATHGGVVDSGEPGLRVDVNMMHFRSQFMDPDTAAQVTTFWPADPSFRCVLICLAFFLYKVLYGHVSRALVGLSFGSGLFGICWFVPIGSVEREGGC